ncbi:MAG TPA: ABC transporter permease [Polyangiales bacterium]|nr:ABC transporter permease [Polyangiales bacterium]
MNLFQTFRVALLALLRNKLRSFLTTLGIVIGVGAVIAMVAIGEGAKARVEQSFQSVGANLLVIMNGSTRTGGAMGGFGSMPSLTWDDLLAIRTEVATVRAAAAQLQMSSPIASEDQNWTTQVVGTSPDFFVARSWPLSIGTMFSISDVEAGSKVAVLGQTVVDQLFGRSVDPTGQIVRIRNVPFTVIGVLERKGQSPMGQDFDDTVIVPETTFQAKIRGGLQKFVQGIIYVSAVSASDTTRAQSQITSLLRERHNLAPEQDDDFSLRSLAEMASAQQEGMKTLTTLLASIAAVSLLVGGIGIMNIMLVSVTERTREIGLRMAIGAKPANILAQFLMEALVLSSAGGVIGVALGVLSARQLAARFDWPLLVQPDIVVIAVSFSAAVGVVFGLYPARKASQLDPIDALRYE